MSPAGISALTGQPSRKHRRSRSTGRTRLQRLWQALVLTVRVVMPVVWAVVLKSQRPDLKPSPRCPPAGEDQQRCFLLVLTVKAGAGPLEDTCSLGPTLLVLLGQGSGSQDSHSTSEGTCPRGPFLPSWSRRSSGPSHPGPPPPGLSLACTLLHRGLQLLKASGPWGAKLAGLQGPNGNSLPLPGWGAPDGKEGA